MLRGATESLVAIAQLARWEERRALRLEHGPTTPRVAERSPAIIVPWGADAHA